MTPKVTSDLYIPVLTQGWGWGWGIPWRALNRDMGLFQGNKEVWKKVQVWEQEADAGRVTCPHFPSSALDLPYHCFPPHLPSPANLFAQIFKPD